MTTHNSQSVESKLYHLSAHRKAKSFATAHNNGYTGRYSTKNPKFLFFLKNISTFWLFSFISSLPQVAQGYAFGILYPCATSHSHGRQPKYPIIIFSMWYQHLFDQYYGIDYVAALCAIVGMFYIGNKNRAGFVLYMLATSFGIVFAILAKSPPLVVTNTIIFSMNLRNFLKWKK